MYLTEIYHLLCEYVLLFIGLHRIAESSQQFDKGF